MWVVSGVCVDVSENLSTKTHSSLRNVLLDLRNRALAKQTLRSLTRTALHFARGGCSRWLSSRFSFLLLFFFPPPLLSFVLTRPSLPPDLNFEGSANWGHDGYSWLSAPRTDPLVFWPPYDENVFNFSGDPLEIYKDAGLSEVKDNLGLFHFLSFFFFRINLKIFPIFLCYLLHLTTSLLLVVMADLLVRKNTFLRSKETMLEGGMIAMFMITSATGMPVELCNDEDLSSGKCQRGFFFFFFFFFVFFFFFFFAFELPFFFLLSLLFFR